MKKPISVIIAASMLLSLLCGCENEPTNTGTSEISTEADITSQAPTVDSFYITEITDEIFDRIYGKSFKEDCTLQERICDTSMFYIRI